MITTCKRSGVPLAVPVNIPGASLRSVPCRCGHSQMVVGMPSLVEPTRIEGRRSFPWLPEFPLRR